MRAFLSFLCLALAISCGVMICVGDHNHFLSYDALGGVGLLYGLFIWLSAVIALAPRLTDHG